MGLAPIEWVRWKIQSGSEEARWPADSASVIAYRFPVCAVTLNTVLRVYHRFDDFHALLGKAVIQRLLEFIRAACAPEGQSVEVGGVFEIKPGGCRPIAFEGIESGLRQVAEYAPAVIVDNNQGGVAVRRGKQTIHVVVKRQVTDQPCHRCVVSVGAGQTEQAFISEIRGGSYSI